MARRGAARAKGLWVAALGLVALACSGSGGAGFPYAGPSCASTTVSNACWGCVQASCGELASCVTGPCASFAACYCQCTAGDATCQGNCFANASRDCRQCWGATARSCAACERPCAGGPFGRPAPVDAGSAGRCASATATASCPTAGDVPCDAASCCPARTPYGCASNRTCYAAEIDAVAACGSACLVCAAAGVTDAGRE